MENCNSLLQLARDETSLSDFGSDSFLEGLEVLVSALQEEARLNALGEQLIQERILKHLKQRLQIEDWYKRHPDIDDVQISAPLIGLSLPRTGSTVLSFLLAQDPEARSLYRDEAADPCPPPSRREWQSIQGGGNDPLLRAGLKPHVPGGNLAPAECQDLMALDFKSHIFQALAQIPSYSNWLLKADLRSTYHYERRVLKLLQWGFVEKKWRLKCPTHLLFLAHLDDAFPDARFVMTHRDPMVVMQSVVDVYVDLISNFTEHVDVDYLTELNIRHWSTGMQRTLDFRDAGNESRFFDIQFDAISTDPVAEIKRLYQWLGEAVSEDYEQAMINWSAKNAASREEKGSRKVLQKKLDLEHTRPLFAGYSARFVESS